MKRKVLFVDDERAILRAIQRRIGFEYAVEIAESGPEALEKIQNSGPYEIIFTDMRMPKMDGLEFILQARELTPDSLFVMLTGNNDKDTADHAHEQGRVFRFLNKPCDPDEIKATIEECVHELEHVLTCEAQPDANDPLSSLLKLQTEVLETRLTALAGRSQGIAEKIDCLRKAVDLKDPWELRAAAEASNLGFALLPESMLLGFTNSEPLSSEAQEIRAGAWASSCQLLRDAPGLENLASIFEQSGTGTGALECGDSESQDQNAKNLATLLYVATLWEDLSRHGTQPDEIAYTLKIHLPDLPEAVTNLISESWPRCLEFGSEQVQVTELQEGMVIGAEVRSPEGDLLVREGSRVTSAVLEWLQWYPGLEPIQLATCSIENDAPVLVP